MTLDIEKSNPVLDSVISRNLADVEIKPIEWFWRNALATKVNVIGGAPGLGKSQLVINLAATLTTGGRLPDNTPCEKGSAIILTTEDDAADTICPRALAAGADLSKIEILDAIATDNGRKPWTVDDLSELEKMIDRIGDVRLIIFDPITAHMGNRDSHKATDVRAALAPLQALADKHHICMLMITHLNKSQGASALDRFNGSTSFQALSRSVWLVGEHPTDESLRVFVPVKNNIGNDRQGYGYKIESVQIEKGIETSRIVWQGPVDLPADDVVNGPKKSLDDPDNKSVKAAAARFLLDQVKDGPKLSREIYKEAEAEGYSASTMKRAKKELEIDSYQNSGGWYMRIPDSDGNTESEGSDSDSRTRNPDTLDTLTPCPVESSNKSQARVSGVQEVHSSRVSDAPGDIDLNNF